MKSYCYFFYRSSFHNRKFDFYGNFNEFKIIPYLVYILVVHKINSNSSRKLKQKKAI